ncbi:LptF/LptG family permease [Reichenbachiella sp. MALMAid0571]|uniref:LptF/LptG family permease n=1 Tax=Reichenbachiella sp. MALMAid0571 TaxID=3143939 RepID=UPI0032E01DA7
MKLIDKYILKKFLTTFAFVVLVLVTIIVVIDFTEKNYKFIDYEVPGREILKYYLTFIPFIAGLITPITVFIAAVLVTANLAVRTEIIAILSNGISFRRMMFPYFLGASMIAIVSFYLNGWWLPDLNKIRLGFEVEYLEKPFYFNERDVHMQLNETDFLYFQRYNNRSDIAFKVTLERIKEQELVQKLTAEKMKWDTLTRKWELQNWNRRTIKDFGEEYETGEKLDTLLNIKPEDFAYKYRLNEALTIDELNEYIAILKSRSSDEVEVYEIEKYIRYMLPYAVIILTLIGISVSAEKSRGGTGFKVALGFLIAFIYLIMFVLAKAIAEAGSISNNILAIWMPNIIGLIAGLILYRFVPR